MHRGDPPEDEPPTERFEDELPVAGSRLPVQPRHSETASGNRQPSTVNSVFDANRFHFTTGLSAGEIVHIRDDRNAILLTYRSFASVVGIVAALVSGIVAVAGVAATAFLFLESYPLYAIAALALSLFFALMIPMLVPATSVTLYEGDRPALTIAQQSRVNVPSVTFGVVTPDGRTLALVRKSLFSRLGRNRWRILDPSSQQVVGEAIEESLGRALRRKISGKFSRASEANVRLRFGGDQVGWILRRPAADGAYDVLEVRGVIDGRVAVAVATLVLGSEP